MRRVYFTASMLAASLLSINLRAQTYHELYRPQIHFSPKANWMNDPNGMVYLDDTYHLFFQYYPDSTVWGPMHWGHATSLDMIHWKEEPIALYPDSIGYIFSGSAVVDKNNTSGFGKNGKAPLVAIFTQHDPAGEKQNTDNFQTQSIAYSLDNGRTWTKYKDNPVVKNPGIKDFRDPKVIWYEPAKKWVMILAVKDRVSFYSSPNLKNWTKESDFGEHTGAHGGVWECPDIFSLNDGNKEIWVVTCSINPGAPNGGSGTQYFVGDFDGKIFATKDTITKWIDYGTDNYAGVTWSNTGNRKLFLGWMSNWNYAQVVPTAHWRSANTIPRELKLQKINGSYYIASLPVKELTANATIKTFAGNYILNNKVKAPYALKFLTGNLKTFELIFSNDAGEQLAVGFDTANNRYYIDRSKAGKSDFSKDFAGRSFAPRIAQTNTSDITVVIDNASIEFFADGGLTTMTEIFFPSKPYNNLTIGSTPASRIEKLEYIPLKSIWP